jgi:hypothetical protein
MKGFSITLILLTLLAICIVMPVSAADISFSPSSITFYSGQTTDITIVIDELPDGLAGYVFTTGVSSPSVAEISEVSFPDWASLNNVTGVQSASVRISGIDMSEQVEPGAKDVVLGTITVRAKSTGSATLNLNEIRAYADGGDMIVATVDPASITVQSTSGGGGGGGGGGSDNTYIAATTVTITKATTLPTTPVPGTTVTTAPAGAQPTGTPGQVTTPVNTIAETTPATPAPSAASAFLIPWYWMVLIILMVGSGMVVLYLALTGRM